MVASRSCYHTRSPRGLSQDVYLVGGAADLEGAGGLQMVGFEHDITAEQSRQRTAALEGRDRHLRPDRIMGTEDSIKQRRCGHELVRSAAEIACSPASSSGLAGQP
jgi:hypothetical protein